MLPAATCSPSAPATGLPSSALAAAAAAASRASLRLLGSGSVSCWLAASGDLPPTAADEPPADEPPGGGGGGTSVLPVAQVRWLADVAAASFLADGERAMPAAPWPRGADCVRASCAAIVSPPPVPPAAMAAAGACTLLAAGATASPAAAPGPPLSVGHSWSAGAFRAGGGGGCVAGAASWGGPPADTRAHEVLPADCRVLTAAAASALAAPAAGREIGSVTERCSPAAPWPGAGGATGWLTLEDAVAECTLGALTPARGLFAGGWVSDTNCIAASPDNICSFVKLSASSAATRQYVKLAPEANSSNSRPARMAQAV